MTYWLRAVVQFVVLTFQSEQKFLQMIRKWESCASKAVWSRLSGLILRVHTEILYFKTLQTLLGVCQQIKTSKKLFISVAELIWKGMVGNFSIGKKKCESLFVS